MPTNVVQFAGDPIQPIGHIGQRQLAPHWSNANGNPSPLEEPKRLGNAKSPLTE